MQLSGNTILITGGSEGIGLEMARSLAAENTVIICGRDEEKLARAKGAIADLVTMACDVTVSEQRQRLVSEVLGTHPDLNLLINNAGGRQVTDLTAANSAQAACVADVALNFSAPVALCQLVSGHLRSQPTAAIVNVTTGLVHLPKAAYPFYCAAKAALHSYTRSLRWALRGTSVEIFEVLMPLVDTGFHEGRLPETTEAIDPVEAAGQALRGLAAGNAEIHVGKAGLLRWLAVFAPWRGMALVNRG